MTGGYHLAFLIASALVVGALVVALTVLRPERAAPGPGHAAVEEEPAGARPAYSEST
jgi:hypothetical protein